MADDQLKRAQEQGQVQYESIRELVADLTDDSKDSDRSREAIHEDTLSVLVRSGWYVPGRDEGKPEDFQFLLCWGGPAARLIGILNQHGEPDSATMQVQDWFQPWTDFQPNTGADADDILLTYARCFYFGE